MRFVLFFVVMVFPLAAEPVRSFESTWSVRQTWDAGGPGSGVELTASVSGFLLPGLWTGVSGGLDSRASWSGEWRSLEAGGTYRAGIQVPWGRSVLVVPWLGAGGPAWRALAGIDTEVRLTDRLHGVVGLSVTTDLSVAVTLGLRDRTSWKPPAPEVPSARVTVGPDGLSLQFEASGGLPAALWSWAIEGPGGQVFYQQAGEGAVPRRAVWTGVSLWGESLASATRYQAVFKVTDGMGRVAEARAGFETGLVVLREGGRAFVRLPRPRDEDPLVLDQVARLLTDVRGPVTITGHTNLVQWLNPTRAREENTRDAVPQTLGWAQALKGRLAARGVATSMMVRGEGGSQPLVPFGDEDNAWKNRRLEISWTEDPAVR